MTSRNDLKAKTSPFAHLGRTGAAATEDDDKQKDETKKANAESDDKDKKDDDKKDNPKKSKTAKAEADDDEGDEGEPKKDKAKGKAKKAKADDDGDDDMEDEETEPDAKSARARERSRIRAILVSEPGKANPVAAAHLATGTSMPRNQAIEMLSAMQAGQPKTVVSVEPKRDTLRDRMADVPNATIGSDAQQQPPNLAAQIIAADKKRRGEA